MENKLTRANKLSICLAVFYAVLALVTGFGLDANYTIFARNNPISALGKAFGFPSIAATAMMWVMLLFIVFYLVLFVISCCYIAAYQRRHGRKTYCKEAFYAYGIALAIALFLSLGVGSLFHLIVGMESYGTTMLFVSQALVLAALFFVILSLLVYAIIGIAVYCVGFAKVNLTSYNEEQVKKEEKERKEFLEEQEGADKDEKDDVVSSFEGEKKEEKKEGPAPVSSQNAPEGEGKISSLPAEIRLSPRDEEKEALPPKEQLFPTLCAIDERNAAQSFVALDSENVDLPSLIDDLRSYLAKKEGLFYPRKELALFVAAMNATHLIILKGISGTGKSSLPRYFAKFIGEESFFEPIQVTYKEKSDLLGYYNEFTRRYMETNFLRRLYQSSYEPERLNLMVLDEMNISRVEYYFADFLSVMEFPEEDRHLLLLSLPEDYDAPLHLHEGEVDLLPNTYFIGTCNKDDSTYTVTDKVIDRAIVIDFESYQRPFEVPEEVHPILLTYRGLKSLFQKAEGKEENLFSEEERKKFLELLSFMEEEFSIALGNRIVNQIQKMMPVFAEMGEKREDLLDEIFLTKVFRKLQGRMDSSLSLSLSHLLSKIDSLYGKDSYPQTRKAVLRMIERIGL